MPLCIHSLVMWGGRVVITRGGVDGAIAAVVSVAVLLVAVLSVVVLAVVVVVV